MTIRFKILLSKLSPATSLYHIWLGFWTSIVLKQPLLKLPMNFSEQQTIVFPLFIHWCECGFGYHLPTGLMLDKNRFFSVSYKQAKVVIIFVSYFWVYCDLYLYVSEWLTCRFLFICSVLVLKEFIQKASVKTNSVFILWLRTFLSAYELKQGLRLVS